MIGKKEIIGVMLVFYLCQANAQNKASITNSNYTPTSSVYLNPASIADSKTWLDINIIGIGAFAHNNFVYLPKSNLYTLLRSNNVEAQTKTSRFNKHAYVLGNIQGPSASINIGEHAFGLRTTVRSYTNVNRVSSDMAELAIQGLDYEPLQNINNNVSNATTDHLTWAEVGLSYAKIVRKQGRDLIQVGGTIKRLFGISSGGVQINNADYIVLNDTTMNISNFSGDIYYTEPQFRAGAGWGLDAGVTYKRMKSSVNGYVPHSTLSGCAQKEYHYKLGISLLDVGRIKFENNATFLSYEGGFGNLPDQIDASVNSVEAAGNDLIEENGSVSSNTVYKQHLPMALSAQFDYNLGRHFFANATIIQGLKRSRKLGVIAPNSLTVSIRYETKWLEFHLPISLYDYRYPIVGAAVRIHNLTVGSDYLSPFLFKTNLYRGDVYMNFKIPFYKSPNCKDKSRNGRKKNKKNNMKYKGGLQYCPAF